MKNDTFFLSFVAAVAALRENHRASCGYTFCESYGASFEIPKGAKFARVLSTEKRKEARDDRSQIYCFVALEDGQTKGLGVIKKGDIFKPASYKAPARHARGNIYAPDNGLTMCNHFGPEYLR